MYIPHTDAIIAGVGVAAMVTTAVISAPPLALVGGLVVGFGAVVWGLRGIFEATRREEA